MKWKEIVRLIATLTGNDIAARPHRKDGGESSRRVGRQVPPVDPLPRFPYTVT
jgi:hypothetical protein